MKQRGATIVNEDDICPGLCVPAPAPRRRVKNDIRYTTAPYGYIATIPAGTPVIPATNLPKPGQYWAEPWEGMSDQAESWHRTYGFLLDSSQVTL
jgi:hypothetical protein